MLPDDVVAKIVSYLPEGSMDVFEEHVLEAALKQRNQRIRDGIDELYGVQTILQILNDGIPVPENWLSIERYEVHGYFKWVSYRQFDFPFRRQDILEDLLLKSVYPKIEAFCCTAPVRVQCRLIHNPHVAPAGADYEIGILWPSIAVCLSIQETIQVEPECSTDICRSYQWKKTLSSGKEFYIDMTEDDAPEHYNLFLHGTCDWSDDDIDAIVCFIETVMNVFPQSVMPKWNTKMKNVNTDIQRLLHPYKNRLWKYGIELYNEL